VSEADIALPDRRPALAAFGCYTIWGLLPLVLFGLRQSGATPLEILSQRTVWAAPIALLIVILAGQGAAARALLGKPKALMLLVLSALLIAGNWGVYIWAVLHGRALETSLGYYLNPLLNMAAGAVLFRERINSVGRIAIALAAAGVAAQGVALGHIPYVSLALALSFCAYGIVRKHVDADAQTGLLVECALLAVPGLLVSAWLMAQGEAAFGRSAGATLGLVLMGPLTAVPLALFSWAARRMAYSTLGFIQFLAPTLTFVIGLAAGEEMGTLRLISFLFIWSGAAVFIYGLWHQSRRVLETAF
jgi:chloramphenicol-sensitive protein RarD